jgi:hypothetical protein
MQDYPVVSRVPVMSMGVPVAGLNMNFYVSPGQPISGIDQSVAEIGTQVIVASSRVYYPDWLTVFRGQLSSVKQQLLPHSNNISLCDITYQPSHLDNTR